MTVENTFGRWKGRFRRFLKKVDMNVMNVTTAVAAFHVLYTICVKLVVKKFLMIGYLKWK
jgi:hypothetical protein